MVTEECLSECVCLFIPSELAWAVSVAPAGLSSSEVDDEEEEFAREWDSLFRLRAGPVQLSKYLEHTNDQNTHIRQANNIVIGALACNLLK